jgi:phosphatase and actin regulator 4
VLVESLSLLVEGGLDPSLAAVSEQLKKAHLKDILDTQISNRPAISTDSLNKFTEFKTDVKVIPTFRKSEYNRKPDSNATFRKLTPKMKMEIREELNNFKRNEMAVHEDSLQNTCFH